MNITNNKFTLHILLVVVVAAGFVSCRNYKSLAEVPQTDLKTVVREHNQTNSDTLVLDSIPWKAYFVDEKLQTLIAEGIENSYNMKVALSRIQQADAALYLSRSALLPSLSATARISHTRRSTGAAGTDVFGYASNINSLGLVASWEADLWGKLSSQSKAKYANYLNTLEYKKLIQTNLVASVAKAYYSLMAYDEQLRTTKENLILLTKSVETMQALKNAGLQTAAAVEQSKALLYNTQLSVYDLESKIRQQENAISVLIGRAPGAIERNAMSSMLVPATMNSGVSLLSLANRPDVKQAELSLQSAYALTDAARASFYPSFSISSLSVGLAAGGFASFFKPENLAAEIIGGLTQPIFMKGQLKANLRITQAQQEEALMAFTNSLLVAGQEVSDILYTYKALVNKNEWREKQVESLTKSVDYTQDLLRAGEATYTEVLNAQKDLLSAQLSKTNDKLDQLIQSVNLYKALGGGIE